jgi:cobalt-zinc-cadmium efflux system membrane fusion protein
MLTLLALGLSTSCSRDSVAAATKASVDLQPGVFRLDHSDSFKLAGVETRNLPTLLNANGTVTPDVNSTVHVTSLGSGRVVDLKVRLGDYVHKGQSLLTISSPDLSSALADYEKARADEQLSSKGLARAQLLYSHGAAATKEVETAQDEEDKAKADLGAAQHRVQMLGGNPATPSAIIDLRAPVSGTIVEQNVADAEGIKSLDSSNNLFTIADLSHVWVLADVYENDLGEVHLGDPAEIRLNAFPDRVFRGTVANISRVLDPNTRSAKVRIDLPNSDGALRPGMFASASFRSRNLQSREVVPTSSIMRLHDKDWVFRREGEGQFRQVEVHCGSQTGDGSSEILDGDLKPGQQVVEDALQFSTEVAENK